MTGLPPAIVERMSSLVTVYSGKAQVDVVDADAETLAALPGVTPDALADVLQARAAGAAGKDLIARLGPASAGATIEPTMRRAPRSWCSCATGGGFRPKSFSG